MTVKNKIALCGFHHARLPVSDLERSFEWYATHLGYERDFDFKKDGKVVAWALLHPSVPRADDICKFVNFISGA